MSDPFYLADILLGRVGVLRSTAESIVLELCEAQAKLDAQANGSGESGASGGGDPGSTSSALVASSSDDALRLAIKNKLERVQTNLKLLRKLVPEFGTSRGMCVYCFLCMAMMTGLYVWRCVDGKTKPIDNVNQTHR